MLYFYQHMMMLICQYVMLWFTKAKREIKRKVEMQGEEFMMGRE